MNRHLTSDQCCFFKTFTHTYQKGLLMTSEFFRIILLILLLFLTPSPLTLFHMLVKRIHLKLGMKRAVSSPPSTMDEVDSAEMSNLQWATSIKSHHYHIQTAFRKLAEASQKLTPDTDAQEQGSERRADDLDVWGSVITSPEESERLTQYATAMHHLATLYWEQEDKEEADSISGPASAKRRKTEGIEDREGKKSGDNIPMRPEGTKNRHNSRIQSCLDCLTEYFMGLLHHNTGNPERDDPLVYARLPFIFSKPLKEMRREFYKREGRMATPVEVESMIEKVRDDAVTRGAVSGRGCWQTAVQYYHTFKTSRHVSLLSAGAEALTAGVPKLNVLDVGSCYGPFFHCRLNPCCDAKCSLSVPLAVTAIDLEPYVDPNSSNDSKRVLKGDWLTLPFTETLCTDADDSFLGIPVGGYDAVIFCLLLSYLPTPALRFRAVVKAHVALAEEGLLLIVCTRTQGGRRDGWENSWIIAIESIGFVRIHKYIREKIVMLSFSKKSTEDAVDTAAKATAFVERQMMSKFANTLRITADAI